MQRVRYLKQGIKYLLLYLVGASSYYLLETLWRGYSHLSMFILGGLCFLLIGLIGEHYFKSHRHLIKQMLISSLIITILELAFGLVVNVRMGLGVWDYTSLRFNFMGQISLIFTVFWFFLSLPAIFFYDYMRYWLFGEERPSYKLI